MRQRRVRTLSTVRNVDGRQNNVICVTNILYPDRARELPSAKEARTREHVGVGSFLLVHVLVSLFTSRFSRRPNVNAAVRRVSTPRCD